MVNNVILTNGCAIGKKCSKVLLPEDLNEDKPRIESKENTKNSSVGDLFQEMRVTKNGGNTNFRR